MSRTPLAASRGDDTPAIRLHVADALAPELDITLSAPQTHYLLTVMRRLPGDAVRVFNAVDGEYRASIVACRRDQAVLRLGACMRLPVVEPDLWLAFALLKRHSTDLVVQKATELGVSAILPVFTTRTNADRANLVRLQAIATEAAEQSQRLTVPVIHPPRALSGVLAGWPAERRLAACCERGAATRLHALPEPAGLMIGPEGGFTDVELDALRAHPFVAPVTLGPRILRAETAAIVGLALLQAA